MIAVLVLLLVWVLLTLKTSRSDGQLVKQLHPYRKMLFHIMPSKTESVVFYEETLRAETLLAYTEKSRALFQADLNHLLVAATGVALRENPEMNRFIRGCRLYQRSGVWLTFSMKRKKLEKESRVAAVKLEIDGTENFEELSKRINGLVDIERSSALTYADRELGFFAKVPRPILRGCVGLFSFLDYFNLLPGSFIEKDGLYTSAFIANLGSLGMKAGYHHLFEWGNCPVFITLGEIEERAVIEEGAVVVGKVLPIRITYDERIDDGLTAKGAVASLKRILSEPQLHLGCIAEDGSDRFALGAVRSR